MSRTCNSRAVSGIQKGSGPSIITRQSPLLSFTTRTIESVNRVSNAAGDPRKAREACWASRTICFEGNVTSVLRRMRTAVDLMWTDGTFTRLENNFFQQIAFICDVLDGVIVLHQTAFQLSRRCAVACGTKETHDSGSKMYAKLR